MNVRKLRSIESYPEQGSWINKRVRVCFNYDLSKQYGGVIVREDVTEPGIMIIRLDGGQHVMALECQYSLEPGQ